MTAHFLILAALCSIIVGGFFFILMKAVRASNGVALILTGILMASFVCEVIGFRLLIN